MEAAEKLFEEIRQIKVQYKAEVSGGRKQWPRAIKSRVMQLSDMGVRMRRIAEQTGVSYHTVSAWRSQQAGKNKFHQLPVVVETRNKPGRPKNATVTVTKKSKILDQKQKLVTVTVTTPEGFVVQIDSLEAAVEMILQLKQVR